MKRGVSALWLVLGCAVAVPALSAPARATLGEYADSVNADKAAITATGVATVPREDFTVREIRSDAVTLREYIAPSGIIFAIAWNGHIHPDLTPLLGSYAGDYEAGLAKTPREPGRRRLRVQTDRVVVEKWGHMRNLQGRAYVPAVIPSGVKVDEIK